MLFWTTIKMALKSLYSNKMRSILAMLGIIIGVSAVISMLALGSGAKASVMKRISAMGKNLLVIRPGQGRHRGVSTGTQQNLTLEDATAIIKKVKDVKMMTPVVRVNAQVKFENKNARSAITGAAITYFMINNFEIDKGRKMVEREAERLGRVAVLGSAITETLFEKKNPVGEKIKIKGINFKVIGVLKSKGDQGHSNPDEQIVIPYTTAMKILFGQSRLKEIDIYVREGADLTKVEEEITTLIRKRHKIKADAENDFRIRNQAEILATATQITGTFTILLGGIAGISLLVGGIGIMNIMLVTVTERTREIGIRKSIGAKNINILLQFLIESILMSSVGGGIGILIGFGGAELITKYSPFQAVVTSFSVILSFSFSFSVGIFFGFYPAYKAAKLNPIDALRYE